MDTMDQDRQSETVKEKAGEKKKPEELEGMKHGPTAKPNFECIVATDGQEFKVGGVTIKAIHTPGHTLVLAI